MTSDTMSTWGISSNTHAYSGRHVDDGRLCLGGDRYMGTPVFSFQFFCDPKNKVLKT